MTTFVISDKINEDASVPEFDHAVLTVSEKGQITLPIAIRRKLGMEAGGRLELTVCDNKIVLRRIRTIAELSGILKDHAKPGTTWEQEREAIEKSIAEEAVSVD